MKIYHRALSFSEQVYISGAGFIPLMIKVNDKSSGLIYRRIWNICLSNGSYIPPGDAVEITSLLQEIGYIDIHIDLDLSGRDGYITAGCHTAITL